VLGACQLFNAQMSLCHDKHWNAGHRYTRTYTKRNKQAVAYSCKHTPVRTPVRAPVHTPVRTPVQPWAVLVVLEVYTTSVNINVNVNVFSDIRKIVVISKSKQFGCLTL
jgi:hypothetical protein